MHIEEKQVTIKQISEFIENVNAIFKNHPKIEFTKLGYAMNKTSEKAQALLKDFQTSEQEFYDNEVKRKAIDFAMVDKDGAIKYDTRGNFVFDKEGQKKWFDLMQEFNKKQTERLEVFEKTIVGIDPFIVNASKKELSYVTPFEYDKLKGFVLPEHLDIEDFCQQEETN